MSSFIQKIISFLVFRPEKSSDVLEAYPERLHVTALPERRYLKTARFLVIATLLSLTFNFAMAFIYIRNSSLVESVVHNPNRQDTFLYQLDYYNKELKPIQKPFRNLSIIDLIYQNLIADYLNERYQVTSNRAEMETKWGAGSKIVAYAPKLYEAFIPEANEALARQARGITQEVYIYSIKNISGNLYEVIFDVYALNESGYGDKKCPCKEKTLECLQCMRQTTVGARRYKAYMRVGLNIQERPSEEIRKNINPYYFTVDSYIILPQVIRIDNPWEDVDAILD